MTSIREPDIDEIQALLTRGSIYAALAKAFGPNVEMLHKDSLLKELGEAVKPLHDSELSSIFSKIQEVSNRGSWTLEDLKLEQTRLFVKGDAKPYETSFDRDRPYGKTHDLADIAGFYMAFGVKPGNELPDHIVCELEFMSLLCLKESYALAHSLSEQAEICSTAQRKFLEQHLGRWLKPFSKHLKERAKIPVYPLLADLTHRFTAYHAEKLGAKID